MHTPNTANHDTLVYRLAHIPGKLNDGQKLDPKVLANEFNVEPSTIQRDLKELVKTDGLHRSDSAFLGKRNLRDVGHFANMEGVRGLFPLLSDDFLRDFFDTRSQSALLVKGHEYENLGGKEQIFCILEQAMALHTLTFSYKKSEGTKTYADMQPNKLVNKDGIWYLTGKDGDKLEVFSLTKIDTLQVLSTCFTADLTIEKTLTDEDDLWPSVNKIEVILKISNTVAEYFKRHKLVAAKVIKRELVIRCLIISAKVARIHQIVSTMCYWIPNIRIISPEGMLAVM